MTQSRICNIKTECPSLPTVYECFISSHLWKNWLQCILSPDSPQMFHFESLVEEMTLEYLSLSVLIESIHAEDCSLYPYWWLPDVKQFQSVSGHQTLMFVWKIYSLACWVSDHTPNSGHVFFDLFFWCRSVGGFHSWLCVWSFSLISARTTAYTKAFSVGRLEYKSFSLSSSISSAKKGSKVH